MTLSPRFWLYLRLLIVLAACLAALSLDPQAADVSFGESGVAAAVLGLSLFFWLALRDRERPLDRAAPFDPGAPFTPARDRPLAMAVLVALALIVAGLAAAAKAQFDTGAPVTIGALLLALGGAILAAVAAALALPRR